MGSRQSKGAKRAQAKLLAAAVAEAFDWLYDWFADGNACPACGDVDHAACGTVHACPLGAFEREVRK